MPMSHNGTPICSLWLVNVLGVDAKFKRINPLPGHLIDTGFGDWMAHVSIQEELKQSGVAEDGSVEETRTPDCPLQHLMALPWQ